MKIYKLQLAGMLCIALAVLVNSFAPRADVFVSYMAWQDESSYKQAWGTYSIDGAVDGGVLNELKDYIKEHEDIYDVTILNWRRCEK